MDEKEIFLKEEKIKKIWKAIEKIFEKDWEYIVLQKSEPNWVYIEWVFDYKELFNFIVDNSQKYVNFNWVYLIKKNDIEYFFIFNFSRDFDVKYYIYNIHNLKQEEIDEIIIKNEIQDKIWKHIQNRNFSKNAWNTS